MLTDDRFTELMTRTRAGDQDAASELVRLYEPEIRRAARLRLTDPQLRRMVDSLDICQSVFGRFFKSVADGGFDGQNGEQLLALLTTMTQNRVIDEHRKHRTQKRGRDLVHLEIDLQKLIADTVGPLTATIDKEQVSEIRTRLGPDELDLANRRIAGQSWDHIAAELTESADALRKRLERALERVRTEIHELNAPVKDR